MLRGVRVGPWHLGTNPDITQDSRHKISTRIPGHVALALVGLYVVAACSASTAQGEPAPPDPDLVAANKALGDPYLGRFPLAEALAGLPEGKTLRATLVTSHGTIPCRLDPHQAPWTVANFVGLARGLRPYLDEDGRWATKPYYLQMPFHRAEAGQFIQTGRRGRLGHGGYFLEDEVGYGDSFDRPGVLAMANTGGEHSGSVQFFVTTGPASDLEGSHTIFGSCDGEAIVRRIERQVLSEATPAPSLIRIDIDRG